MNLKKLIDLLEFKDVSLTLENLYGEDYRRNESGYKLVFQKLKDIREIVHSENCMILITKLFGDEGLSWNHVCGKIAGDELTCSLSFTPWKEWLGMKLSQSTVDNYSDKEIVSHCLWEMTYYGFTEEKIKELMDKI
jgi:hypothetical protein